MEKLVIEGGVPLRGTIRVSGSKNAALPILFASLLLDGAVTFHNVPRLRDINTTLAMLKVLGCPAAFTGDDTNTVRVEPGALLPDAPYELVKTMRASVLVLGPLLARLGQATLALPGGSPLTFPPWAAPSTCSWPPAWPKAKPFCATPPASPKWWIWPIF